jgi:hypothetical protein
MLKQSVTKQGMPHPIKPAQKIKTGIAYTRLELERLCLLPYL